MKYWKLLLGLLLAAIVSTFLWRANITWIVAAPDAERYGAELAREGASVKRCLTITTVFPSYPPSGQLRSLCILGYAKEAKDPTACELLMPGEYGLHCVTSLIPDPICRSDYDRNVRWKVGDAWKIISLEECRRRSEQISSIQDVCCITSLAANIKQYNDCLRIPDTFIDIRNQCLFQVGLKDADETQCEKITDSIMRDACIVAAKAKLKNPQICPGCLEPLRQ